MIDPAAVGSGIGSVIDAVERAADAEPMDRVRTLERQIERIDTAIHAQEQAVITGRRKRVGMVWVAPVGLVSVSRARRALLHKRRWLAWWRERAEALGGDRG